MEYQTRRLIANDSMRHMGCELAPGDSFEATEPDARYFLQHRMARAHVAEKAAEAAAAQAPKADSAPTPSAVTAPIAAKSVPPSAKPPAARAAAVNAKIAVDVSKPLGAGDI